MAPALVENAVPALGSSSLKHVVSSGHNKEGFIGSPLEFDKDGELKGTARQPAASFPNYLPVWDNETSKCVWTPCFLFFLGSWCRSGMR